MISLQSMGLLLLRIWELLFVVVILGVLVYFIGVIVIPSLPHNATPTAVPDLIPTFTPTSYPSSDFYNELVTTSDPTYISEAGGAPGSSETEYGRNLPVYITNNKESHDPSYQELLSFLDYDKTEFGVYVDGIRVCSDFATELHNNAEATGIKCYIVNIIWTDAERHMIDVFKTTDQGWIYIDDTGITQQQLSEGCKQLDTYILNFQDNSVYQQSPILPQFSSYHCDINYSKVVKCYHVWTELEEQPTNPAITITPTPVLTASSAPISVTAVNWHVSYAGTTGYLGPSYQTYSGYTKYAGVPFNNIITFPSSSISHTIDSITIGTPGFTLLSVSPSVPSADISAGSSTTETLIIQPPNYAYTGPLDIYISTSPTTVQTPTTSPTVAPTATSSQISITAVNWHINYASTTGYFGPSTRTFDGYTKNIGVPFNNIMTFTSSAALLSHTIDSITVDTPGFTLVSVSPSLPSTDVTPGGSLTETLIIRPPNYAYIGPLDIYISTS